MDRSEFYVDFEEGNIEVLPPHMNYVPIYEVQPNCPQCGANQFDLYLKSMDERYDHPNADQKTTKRIVRNTDRRVISRVSSESISTPGIRRMDSGYLKRMIRPFANAYKKATERDKGSG